MTNEKLILIVDDEELNLELLTDLLQDEGYRIEVASNGQQALDQYTQVKPDLILMDVMMPIMDGYTACQQLREQEKDQSYQTPVIFLSAKANLDDKLKGYEAGGDEYVTKPFDNAELLIKVENILRKQIQIKTLQTDAHQATAMTYQMMTNAAKIGSIGRFLQDSLNCKDLEQLISLFFEMVESFELGCSLKVRWGNTDLVRFHDGIDRPLDKEIITSYIGDEKIFHFGKRRALFNWGNVSLLVRNVGDEADNIAIMMDGLQAGYRAISTQNLLLTAIDDFHHHNHRLASQSAKEVDDLNENLRILFNEFGSGTALTEHEELAISQLIDRHRQHLDLIVNDTKVLEQRLKQSLLSFLGQ